MVFKLYTKIDLKCTWNPQHWYLNVCINQQILAIVLEFICALICITNEGLKIVLISSVWHKNQCVTWTPKTSEITPQSIFYGHMIEENSLVLTYSESTDQNTILELGAGALLDAYLWTRCPWMMPFWYDTYPRAPRVTSVMWQPQTQLAGGLLTWTLKSSVVKFGAR